VWIAHNAAVSIVRACAVALAAMCQAIALLLPSARSIKTRLMITVLLKPTPPTVFTTTATPALLLLGASGRVRTATWPARRAPAPAAPTTLVSAAVDGDKDKEDGAKEDTAAPADGAKEGMAALVKEGMAALVKEGMAALVKEAMVDLRAAAR